MTSFFDFFLDLVYPPKCALCGAIGERPICRSCLSGFELVEREREGIKHLASAHYLYEYQGGPAEAVKRLKYKGATSLATPMAEMIRSAAERLQVADADCIVPVPIHWTRRFHRGFNQAELLAGELPAGRVNRRLLRRVRATRPQVGLSSEARARNIRGAFAASARVAGKRVLLVDDVLTTGSTASECARCLLAAGAREVHGLFFAGESLG